MADAYNPLDKINLGKSVVEALLVAESRPIETIQPFEGAGIYAIYYHGSFEPYQPIAAMPVGHAQPPIYVGKAVPSGSRKGASLTTTSSGR